MLAALSLRQNPEQNHGTSTAEFPLRPTPGRFRGWAVATSARPTVRNAANRSDAFLAHQQRFDFGKGTRYLAGLEGHPQLASDLRRGKKPAQSLPPARIALPYPTKIAKLLRAAAAEAIRGQ